MELVRYDAACRAIAEAKSIDEVNEITNRAEAARAYARQAKNRQMELDSLEIRVRAERRLGEIIIDLKKQGVVGQGRGGKDITYDDLGIDHNIAGGAQRLAKISQDRFAAEIGIWRVNAETNTRVEVPLQRFRRPSVQGDRQRSSQKLGRRRLEQNPLDRFRAIDGRLVSDWRFGELDRLDELAFRIRHCVSKLRAGMPIANPDPLDTMEMIFGSAKLAELLNAIWDVPITQPDTGILRVKHEQQRVCEQCGSSFVLTRAPHRDLRRDRFCSRGCATKAQRSKCGTSVASTGPTGSVRADH